ncbi:membrane protein [Levilactobacillus zymae]|uniref:Membrane protein n=1 Tax=Levilactobacillus zymae TaxID=267363 RepID=A0ABQ0WUN5_9LACO|nr:YibE/F family protein [Levilactobacillus zymae]KRL11172.1 multitransmembrane protein [Levilactobacillus zymae DSM 19395]QFR60070.1 YibE/F family protein [Levilactobacillus zymae]GEO71495.1 membrane protein [Levilactobacillus zymae]
MQSFKQTSKVTWWVWLAVLLVGGLLLWGTAHDAVLYHDPIMQVTAVRQHQTTKETDDFQNVDYQTQQTLTGHLLNTKNRGHQLKVTNSYSASGAMDQRYHVGSQLFVVLHHHGGQLSATVKDRKRDTPLVFMLWLVVGLLLLLMQFSGLMAFLSVAANGVLFLLAILLNGSTQGAQVLWIFGSLAVVFAAVTLWLVLGRTRQMVITLATTLGGTLCAILVALVVFHVTHEKGMFYESMQYVTQLPRPLFLAETLLGSLGAVMDESTDIISSLFALKRERPEITPRQIFKSGRQIGSTIMGPLINVLFFIFVADTFPMALLYLKNGNSWGYTFSMNMSMGVVQSLISGIGIVLAVPLASYLASRWLPKEVAA